MAKNQLAQSIDHFRELINEHGGQDAFAKKMERLKITGSRRSRGAVALWMNAKRHTYPDGETLVKLADKFGVSVDWLLGRTEHRQPMTEDDRAPLERRLAAHKRLEREIAVAAIRLCKGRIAAGKSLPTADDVILAVEAQWRLDRAKRARRA